jgi:hypothetical protein
LLRFFCLQVTNDIKYLKKGSISLNLNKKIRHDIERYNKLTENLFYDLHRNKIGMGFYGRFVHVLTVNHSNALEYGPMLESYEGIRRQIWDSHRC